MHKPIIAAVLLIAGNTAADAHAHLKRANPPAGAILTTPPDRVTLTFSEAIEPSFSAVEVTDANGARVDEGPARTAPEDARQFATGLRHLGPGSYTVHWRVLSVDTHKTQGDYAFTIQP